MNAPLTWPNSSLSRSVSARALQSTVTNGRWLRRLAEWMAREISSFPVPVSPWMSTVLVVGAMRATILYTSSMRSEAPTIPYVGCSQWDSWSWPVAWLPCRSQVISSATSMERNSGMRVLLWLIWRETLPASRRFTPRSGIEHRQKGNVDGGEQGRERRAGNDPRSGSPGSKPRPPPKTDLVQKTPRPRRRKASGSNLTRLTSVRLDLVSKSVKISLTRTSVRTVEKMARAENRLRARPYARPRPHPTRQQLRIRYCFVPGRDAGAEPASVRSEGMTSMAVATFLPACASYEAFTLAPSLDVRERGLPAIQLDRCPIIHFESAPHHAEEPGRDVHGLGARVHLFHRPLHLSRPGLSPPDSCSAMSASEPCWAPFRTEAPAVAPGPPRVPRWPPRSAQRPRPWLQNETSNEDSSPCSSLLVDRATQQFSGGGHEE